MHIAFIGIGSNLVDRKKNCEEAIFSLSQNPSIKNIIKSRWYETKAIVHKSNNKVGNVPNFINGVAKIETDLSPSELLVLLQKIETSMGRIRTGKKWEPRIIDLDILFYDDLILETLNLKIPHPELHKRMFVLEPICDIAPEVIHPILKKSVSKIKEEL